MEKIVIHIEKDTLNEIDSHKRDGESRAQTTRRVIGLGLSELHDDPRSDIERLQELSKHIHRLANALDEYLDVDPSVDPSVNEEGMYADLRERIRLADLDMVQDLLIWVNHNRSLQW